MITIPFKNWKLTVNSELTKEAYDNVRSGGTESCTCSDCKNFVDNLENIYPNEIRELFAKLGIDYRKDCETWRMCKEIDGLHRYSGWFHYKGNFLGESCIKELNDKTTTTELQPISENFSIGFCYNNQLTYFEDKENLVQIEFEVKIPWTIDESLESEN